MNEIWFLQIEKKKERKKENGKWKMVGFCIPTTDVRILEKKRKEKGHILIVWARGWKSGPSVTESKTRRVVKICQLITNGCDMISGDVNVAGGRFRVKP